MLGRRLTLFGIAMTLAVGRVSKASADPPELPGKGPIGWDTFRHLDQLRYLSNVTTREFFSFDRGGQRRRVAGTYSCLRTAGSGCVIAEDSGPDETSSIGSTRENGDVTATGRITIVLDEKTLLDDSLQNVVNGDRDAPFVNPLLADADLSRGQHARVPGRRRAGVHRRPPAPAPRCPLG